MSEQSTSGWQERMDVLLLFAALVFLVAYALPIINPGLSPTLLSLCYLAAVMVWALFLVDFMIRLLTANDRRAYLRRNWLAAVAVVVPVLRPAFAVVVLGRRNRRFATGRVVGAVLIAVAGICVLAALATLQSERTNPEANISSFGAALWWSAVTVTTVGYGDYYPTTMRGRLAAGVLMTTGVALVGVISAWLASWFVERVSANADGEAREAAAQAAAAATGQSLQDDDRLEALRAEVQELSTQIAELVAWHRDHR